MYDEEERAEIMARGAHSFAQKHVAVAMSRFGYKPATRTAPTAITSAPRVAPAPPAPARVPAPSPEAIAALIAEGARLRQEEERTATEAKAAKIKKSWQRAIAAAQGKPLPKERAPGDPWAKTISDMNRQRNRH